MHIKKDWILVILQFFLFGVYLFELNFIQLEIPNFLKWPALFGVFIGVVVIIITFFQLGRNLSAFPSPIEKARLITTGIFKYGRHPIYSAILLLLFSYAIYLASEYKIIISFLMLILFHFKTQYEESALMLKFPNYKKYREVTGKFFPKFKGN